MPRAVPMILAVLTIGTAGFVATAFVVQNSLRTVDLSLNLGLAAWQYPPVSVMTLTAGAFALGLVVGAGVFLWRNWGLRAKVRELQRQLAMADAGGF